MDHHNLFRLIIKADTQMVLLNFLFIIFLSATPFTTSLAGRNHESSFAVAVVAVNYLLMNLSFSSIWIYALAKKMIPEDTLKALSSKRENIIILIGIFLLVLSIPFAFVNTYISFSFFIIVIVLHFYRLWHH
jgi:uncharacterized membrane protein